MSYRNPASPAATLTTPRATSNGTGEGVGQQLTELPAFDPAGQNLNDYATYVRKMTSGGTQDFHAPLAVLFPQGGTIVVNNKDQLRSLEPAGPNVLAYCKGGVLPYDNQGGIFITETSTALDNDGDRIRPDNFNGFVWFKFLL